MMNLKEQIEYENIKNSDKTAAKEYLECKESEGMGELGGAIVAIVIFFYILKYVLIIGAIGFVIVIVFKFISDTVEEREKKKGIKSGDIIDLDEEDI